MNFLLHYTIARKISGLYKFSSHRNAIWELGYECDNRKEIENVSFRELDFSDKPPFKGICPLTFMAFIKPYLEVPHGIVVTYISGVIAIIWVNP